MWFRVLAAGGENCKKGLVLGACKYSLLEGEPLVPSLSWGQEGWGQEQAGAQPGRVLLNLL